ncbi:conserved hypothetical protein [Talaromyces stipitatus ATCC 10500]|uniref:Uncharacterized protein n=1 Tax=Talaromyces stipitatus (strain ATCC 10500 / CBS 375.48 / QM 6759 / NRRL 1006) TaxID=441959 RepID=B8MFH1_TALSN|nr:uncharacterized protein TSTA_017790 [Talaromyces stipitatus ATCC 10500]EED16705.1 conserved hypothetical protein [Talaromyces stipitatus ATCC 10500]
MGSHDTMRDGTLHHKTQGEVTTLRFLRRETNIPVPEVIAFDDSCNNEIGFEWILMELMPGVSAYKRWRTSTTFQKVALVQNIAELQAQLFFHTFSGIRPLTVGDEDQQKVHPGEMIRTAAKEEAEDEWDEEEAAYTLELAHRLVDLLPKIFPSLQSPPERSVMLHEDLLLKPQSLMGSVREEELKRQDYGNESDDEEYELRGNEDDDLDNEGKCELYSVNLMEYENPQLRRVCRAHMRKLRPDWDTEIEQNALKHDFIGAVFRCGNGITLQKIDQRVEAIEKGQFLRLRDILEAGLRV